MYLDCGMLVCTATCILEITRLKQQDKNMSYIMIIFLIMVCSKPTLTDRLYSLHIQSILLIFVVHRKMTSSWAGRKEQQRNGGRAREREGLTLVLKR